MFTLMWNAARVEARFILDRLDWTLVLVAMGGAAWALGEQTVALVFAVICPLALATMRRMLSAGAPAVRSLARADHHVHRAELHCFVDDVLTDCAARRLTTAVMILEIDAVMGPASNIIPKGNKGLLDVLVHRVEAALRTGDAVFRSGDSQVTVVLAPTRRADLDVMMAIVDRVQASIAEPVSIGDQPVQMFCCVGLCSEAAASTRSGMGLVTGADSALQVALHQGGEAVRSYSDSLEQTRDAVDSLSEAVPEALETGRIRAWFQPQIDVQSGAILGFEALARWKHPELGTLPAAKFLHAVQAAGKMDALAETILRQAIEALEHWDAAGLSVPTVTLNLSLQELNDPRMAERLIWQVDRAGCSHGRIALEVPEAVAKLLHEETVVSNLEALGHAGFQIELDGFGTGSASLAQLNHFNIRRVKLDADLVQGLDQSNEKARLVRAILGLRQDLTFEVVATGAEAEQDREALIRLGCTQMQGFGVAQPMPLRHTVPWALAPRGETGAALRRMEPMGNA